MGEYWFLTAGRVTLSLGKNYLPDELMTLFRESDRYHHQDLLDEYASRESHEYSTKFENMTGYAVSVTTLRSRLSLTGFDPDLVRSEALKFLEYETAESDVPEGDEDEDNQGLLRSKWLVHESLPMPKLLDKVISWAKSTDGWLNHQMHPYGSAESFYGSAWESIIECYDDPRFALSLMLRGIRRDAVVKLNLTKLIMGGWMEPDELPSQTAERRLRRQTSSSGRIIVITEGSSDSQLIRKAFELVRPDIVDYFAFLDFSATDAPGGTDRVVSLTRGLAAAGVMNRVISVLDNDCAGRDAERQLLKSSLPETFRVMRLPEVEFARSYPTLGPSGSRDEDVNGRACSIEFMFGSEIMRMATGYLPPVRWKSFMPAVGDYQGELVEKRAVQQAIVDGLKDKTLRPEVIDCATALVDKIMRALPVTLGPASTSMSPLIPARVRANSHTESDDLW
ncbi:HEPN/Toprim-associated domain-containing protein [Catellatospora citrea]|uniref:HEPN/Toprim N-terminal domain-containing protein n=1 Tax=Catellatospora citrea TaxID=53366 RepID=A0A8J3KLW1_9ACTN|nr:HEPN/Toprim-associated domain-containing protein [Catellatospora citrea]RKE08848.1 hypothetical protein C8E86_3722 [Catellatospora citrea]GIG02473.1 hypothetical protein Cci01nite_75660 [Catellatospora citrea]